MYQNCDCLQSIHYSCKQILRLLEKREKYKRSIIHLPRSRGATKLRYISYIFRDSTQQLKGNYGENPLPVQTMEFKLWFRNFWKWLSFTGCSNENDSHLQISTNISLKHTLNRPHVHISIVHLCQILTEIIKAAKASYKSIYEQKN